MSRKQLFAADREHCEDLAGELASVKDTSDSNGCMNGDVAGKR
jgi:hypothetical protein